MTLATDRTVLSLRGVSKRFGRVQALTPIDLDIEAGSFVTLLGPSGCGKTTLLRIIAGFETPSEGDLLLDGRSILHLPPEQRPLNMVFQNYALFPHLNVFDNVAYGLRNAGSAEAELRKRVMAALEMVGLGDRATQRIDQLSGGMSQRVALVRAVVNEPRLLLLDEPLSALDLQLRKRMQVELRSLQERLRTTFIHVTHDQDEAMLLSHRVILMRSGRIEQQGTPEEIYSRPVSRFAAEFIGDTNLVPCVLAGCRALPGAAAGVLACDVTIHENRQTTFPMFQASAPAAASIYLSIRPQELSFCDPVDGFISGIIRDRIFIGYTETFVDVGDGLILRVRTDDGPLPPLHAKVGLRPKPGKGVLVV